MSEPTPSALPKPLQFPTPFHYLSGWTNLDRYMMANDPLWKAITTHCSRVGVADTDRIKMLCSALAEQSAARMELIARYAEKFGVLPPQQ